MTKVGGYLRVADIGLIIEQSIAESAAVPHRGSLKVRYFI
jgi:hypothetical protein